MSVQSRSLITWLSGVCSLWRLLSIIAISFPATGQVVTETCGKLEDTDKASVILYLKRLWDVPEHTEVRIETEAPLDSSCYRRLTIVGLRPGPDATVFLSPNKRYLSSSLADIHSDPHQATQAARERVNAQLLPVSAPVSDTGGPLTLVEFIDYECPYCKQIESWLDQMPQETSTQVVRRYVNLPLAMHPWAHSAALYAICVSTVPAELKRLQQVLFTEQSQISTEELPQVIRRIFPAQIDQIEHCHADASTQDTLDHQLATASKIGVIGTPTLFLNGRRLDVIRTKDELNAILAAEIATPLIVPKQTGPAGN